MAHARAHDVTGNRTRPGEAMPSTENREPEPETEDDEPEGDVDDLPRPALVGLPR
jgi:hypothetical protein